MKGNKNDPNALSNRQICFYPTNHQMKCIERYKKKGMGDSEATRALLEKAIRKRGKRK